MKGETGLGTKEEDEKFKIELFKNRR